jgi:predicted ferric reductase
MKFIPALRSLLLVFLMVGVIAYERGDWWDMLHPIALLAYALTLLWAYLRIKDDAVNNSSGIIP